MVELADSRDTYMEDGDDDNVHEVRPKPDPGNSG